MKISTKGRYALRLMLDLAGFDVKDVTMTDLISGCAPVQQDPQRTV